MATVFIELGGEQARRLSELAAVARRSEQDLCREAVERYLEGYGSPIAEGADAGYDALRHMVGIVRHGPTGLSIEHDLPSGRPAVTVFVDSGGWLSVIIESDQYHEVGEAYFRAMLDLRVLVVTTDFVLDEVVTRLRYDIGHAKAAEFLALAHRAAGAGVLRIHRITEDLWKAAEVVFLRYSDVRLSFTDCTSFAWLAANPVDEVFGYDSHFEMMGYVLQPRRA